MLDNNSGLRSSAPQILSIGQLNREVAALLARQFPLIWVRGEISNFTRAASGHCYFSLKDNRAQVRAVLFRGRARSVAFDLRNGLQVDAQVSVSLYEPRGDFQLTVERMRPAGAGDLHQQFLALKEKLQTEGLFDEALKRPISATPTAIGVITSLQAAALRDVIATLARRAPQIPVIVYPSPVQGTEAAPGLIDALAIAARRAECSTLLLVRGGGSLEDLWSFNDERLARAIRASPIPVIAGVGHESDTTIADFAADLRAPTPTAAATMAVPDRSELRAGLRLAARHLTVSMRRILETAGQRLDISARGLRTPREQWHRWETRVEQAAQHLRAFQRERLRELDRRLAAASHRLVRPDLRLREQQLQALARRLRDTAARRLGDQHHRLENLTAQLELVDPEKVIRRGYAVVRTSQGELITSAGQAHAGDHWQVRLTDGEVPVEVSAGMEPALAERESQ